MSRLDTIYRRLLLTKFFVKGWGNPDNLQRIFEFRKIISCREKCRKLVSPDHPVFLDNEEEFKDYKVINGHFVSPLSLIMPGIMPKETEIARFQILLPLKWKGSTKPTCLHLAGTGDHGFWRRRVFLGKPLLRESGIASILLENPYYGCRKPKQQIRSSLHNVSDLFVMGGGLVLESLVLFHWSQKMGFGPLGITGISMGGHMASLAATNWHLPLPLIPCLSWSTASVVFTDGVMSGAIPWKLLDEQFSKDNKYKDHLSKMVQSPEKDRKMASEEFKMGSEFAKNYPKSVRDFLELHKKKEVQGGGEGSGIKFSLQSSFASILKLTTSKVIKPNISKISSSSSRPLSDDQTLDFMRGVMDDCTHLGNFSTPVDTSLIVIVVAKSDAYYPATSLVGLHELWPGSEIRCLDTGHVSAFLFKQAEFRKAITDAFDKYNKKYLFNSSSSALKPYPLPPAESM